MSFDRSTTGVYPIAFTPFLPDGAVDFVSLDRLVDFYRDVGARDAMEAGAAGVMIAPAPHLRTDEQIAAYFAQAVESIGPEVPWMLQDYPLTLTVQLSVPGIAALMRNHPSCVMLKAEDWPGLEKISALRAMLAEGALRPFSILTANGGLFLDFEAGRGADGSMTGYAFPDMLVALHALQTSGQDEAAHDLFDAHLPLIRYEQQPVVGLATRKHVLMRRGLIDHDGLR